MPPHPDLLQHIKYTCNTKLVRRYPMSFRRRGTSSSTLEVGNWKVLSSWLQMNSNIFRNSLVEGDWSILVDTEPRNPFSDRNQNREKGSIMQPGAGQGKAKGLPQVNDIHCREGYISLARLYISTSNITLWQGCLIMGNIIIMIILVNIEIKIIKRLFFSLKTCIYSDFFFFN